MRLESRENGTNNNNDYVTFSSFQVQARECLFEKQQLVEKIDSAKIIENGIQEAKDQSKLLELAQEAQLLSDEYTGVNEQISFNELKEFIPPAWSSLVQVRNSQLTSFLTGYVLKSECIL